MGGVGHIGQGLFNNGKPRGATCELYQEPLFLLGNGEVRVVEQDCIVGLS